MFKRLALIALGIAGLAAAPLSASASSVFGSNLIVNGDAEAGPASASGSDILGATGFVTVGNFTTVTYGAGGGFPAATDPGGSVGGANFFSGGPNNGSSSASQSIDLSSDSGLIDLGTSSFVLSAYLGGFSTQSDNAVLSISFLDNLNGVLGSALLGPVTSTDRAGATGLLFRSANGFVPTGARSVSVNLLMSRTDGDYNDGYADNLSLVLTQGGAPGAVPEPGTWAVMLAGFGMAGAALRRARLYRLVEIAADGTTTTEEFRAKDAESAMAQALSVAEGVAVEIWCDEERLQRRELGSLAA